MRKLLLAYMIGCMLAGSAQAVTITFDGLSGQKNGFSVTSYSEQGFLIEATSDVRYITVGNPTNSLTATGGALEITGGLFSFQGFDNFFMSMDPRASSKIVITGFLDGLTTFSTEAQTGRGFTTFNSSSGMQIFDKIRLDTVQNRNEIFFDNLQVTTANPPVAAVPEPATWAMMIGGFGLIGAAMRRRKTAVATSDSLA